MICMCCARSEVHGRHAHRERCLVHRDAPVLRATEVCRNATPSAERIYGYDVTYVTADIDSPELTCHYVGSETSVRRRTMLRSRAWKIVAMKPLTEAAYIKAYGRGRM